MIAKVKKNPTDPIAIIVGGIIEILAILEVPDQLGLDATQVAQLGGVLIMVAGAIRFMMTKHDTETPAASAPAEEEEKETPSDSHEADSSDDSDDSSDDQGEKEEEKETPVEPAPVVAPPPTVGGE